MAEDKIFELILDSFNTYGPTTTIILLILILLIIICNKSKILDKITDAVDARREEKHRKGLEARDKKTTVINERLAQLLLNTNSDRAVLFEYHNSGANLSGLPFMHVSAHAEAAAPCLSPVSQKFLNMPATCFAKTIKDFDQNNIVVINDVEKECDAQPLLCEYFNTFNAKQLFIAPIKGIKYQLGFIVIARNKRRDISQEDKAEIGAAMQSISSILDMENVQKLLKK